MNLSTWWTNALTGQRTTIGGILAAIGAGAAGIEVSDHVKLIGLILSAAGPVILGTQAHQNNVTSEQVKAAQDGTTADIAHLQSNVSGKPVDLK